MLDLSDILDAKVLIVDDLEANVRLLDRMLREAGYTRVASTMDPREVSGLHRNNRYDLILLDLEMSGMDGFQVMEGLKEIETDGYLPILVITAQPAHRLRALQAGAKDFISKAVRSGRSTDAHPQHAARAAVVQTSRELQQGAGTDGAGADRRTAGKRSALSQPDGAGVRLVLGAGREPAFHQGFRPGSRDARNPG